MRSKKYVGSSTLFLSIENIILSTSIILISTTSTSIPIQHLQIPTIQIGDIDEWIKKREII